MGRRVVLQERPLSVAVPLRNAVFELKLQAVLWEDALGGNGTPEPVPRVALLWFGGLEFVGRLCSQEHTC